MKYNFCLLIFLIPLSAFSQSLCNCQSQLVRMEVNGQTLNNALSESPKIQEILAPSLDTFLKSDTFKEKVVTDYPMVPMGFPFNVESCQKEKDQGDAKFKDINCMNPLLCSDPAVGEDVKEEICVKLPCSVIMGPKGMDKCPADAMARPTMVHYTEPIGLKKFDLKPLSVSTENNKLKACFSVEELELTAGVDVEFDESAGIKYERMGMNNLKLKLDGKRSICVNANLDLASATPLSNIQIERKDGDFVSDKMISDALKDAKFSGLSGYSDATLSILKMTALPPMARYFRSTVEDAVQKALSATFEKQVSEVINTLNKDTPTLVSTPANSFISEMGMGNVAVKKYVDLMECSLLKEEKKSIPADHSCLSQLYPLKNRPLKLKEIPSVTKSADLLSSQMSRYDQVTSEALKNRMLGFQGRVEPSFYDQKIRPLVARISQKQMESNLFNGVQILTHLGQDNGTAGFELSIPEICDQVNPSAHFGRSIPNCQIQTYIDLNELNNLMTTMYKSGRLCHSGRGDFVPETDSSQRPLYNSDGSARGSGCLFAIEEDEDGMRCFLNGAPQLHFDSKSGGYKVDLKTKECFRGSVALGQGKIAGDINFEIGFTPSICGAGDFCLENGQADWSVVPGTARYALKDSSWLNGIVRNTVDKKLNAIMSETIRIPLSSNTGPMSMVPLEASGQIDKGPGFFGACLQAK